MKSQFSVTAVTEVFPEGQKVIAAILEYPNEILDKNLIKDEYSVADRTITNIYVSDKETIRHPTDSGKYVVLELSAADTSAATYYYPLHDHRIIPAPAPGDHFFPCPFEEAELRPAKVEVTQNRALISRDGSVYPASQDPEYNQKTINLIVDDFVQGEFEGLSYNLYIPKDYDPSKSYPLIQFVHDAGVVHHIPQMTLCQGIGATIWASPEEQKKHPCFVLAPQFLPPSIMNDDWDVDPRLDIAVRLLEMICEKYNIDKRKIYTTGQSMGCMSSCEMWYRNPDLFAAALLVGGQGCPERMATVPDARFWIITSQGDRRATGTMTRMTEAMAKNGAKISRAIWDAQASKEQQDENVKALIKENSNIKFASFDIDTLAGGREGGNHHEFTWRYAYSIEAVRDWLFSIEKPQ